MPRRAGGYTPMETLSLTDRLAMDCSWQAHWYRHVSERARGKTVLDAGAGTGYGLAILRSVGIEASGFDVAKISPEVPESDLSNYADGSFDWVLAIDVIEHVEDDRGFLAELLRVARESVFLSTPNWNVSRAVNPYHAREYTPSELQALIADFGFTKPFGVPWLAGANDHCIWVSNAVLQIETREMFDPNEAWNNYGVLLKKVGV